VATLGSEVAQAVAQTDTTINSQYMVGLEGLLVCMTPSEQIKRVLAFANAVTEIFNSKPALKRLLIDPKEVSTEKEAIEQIGLYRKLANLLNEQSEAMIKDYNKAINPKRFSVIVNKLGVKTIEYSLLEPQGVMSSLQEVDKLKLFESHYLLNIATYQSSDPTWLTLWEDYKVQMENARLAGQFPVAETSKIIDDYSVYAGRYGRRLHVY
jgi:hypothetical protein